MTRKPKMPRKPTKDQDTRGGTIVRTTIPQAWENLITSALPAVITIPPKNYIYALDDLLYVECQIKFSAQDVGTPIYLFLSGQTEGRISIGSYGSRYPKERFDRAIPVNDFTTALKQAYERGVPHFGEIEDKLKALLVSESKTELGHRLHLLGDDTGAYFVAKGLCRDVYYEAAMIDGTIRYRVEYIGPDKDKTFSLTADQLWDLLVQNTMWDVPHMFKAPRVSCTVMVDSEYEEDDEDEDDED